MAAESALFSNRELPQQLPDRIPFGEFSIKMEPFVDQMRDGITLYNWGPLFQTTSENPFKPLSQRQIVTVLDEPSGKTIAFDVITKGVTPVQFDETSQITYSEAPVFMDESLRGLHHETQQLLRDIKSPQAPKASLLVRPDEADYIFTTKGRERVDDAIRGDEPGIVLTLRTTERIAPGPGGALLPEDLPDKEAIRRAITKVNNAFSLGIEQETIDTVPLPSNERKPVMQLGQYVMYEPQRISTPWSEEDLYLTTYTSVGPDGDTLAIQTLTAIDPRELMLQQLSEASDEVKIGIERFCPCMRGREGCDCYTQMDQRLKMLFEDPATRKNAMFVFLPLDPTMGWGEVIGDFEHRVRAEIDGVLAQGTVPTTHNVTVRKSMLKGQYPTDRTNYHIVPDLLQHIYTEPRHFRLASESLAKKQALETIGTVDPVAAPRDRRLGDRYYDEKRPHSQYVTIAA